MYEPKDNSGSLWTQPWKGVSKKTGKEYEKYTGSAIIEGVEYLITAFLNDTRTGKQVYNLSFTRKDSLPPRENNQDAKPYTYPKEPEIRIEDIPF